MQVDGKKQLNNDRLTIEKNEWKGCTIVLRLVRSARSSASNTMIVGIGFLGISAECARCFRAVEVTSRRKIWPGTVVGLERESLSNTIHKVPAYCTVPGN